MRKPKIKYKFKTGIDSFKGYKVEELSQDCIVNLLAWDYLEEIILLEEIAKDESN
jgi:hypothetical protein